MKGRMADLGFHHENLYFHHVFLGFLGLGGTFEWTVPRQPNHPPNNNNASNNKKHRNLPPQAKQLVIFHHPTDGQLRINADDTTTRLGVLFRLDGESNDALRPYPALCSFS